MAKIDIPVEDRGCQWAPRCVECPWRVCIPELAARERNEITAAIRLVRGYFAAPDRALG